MLRFMSSSAPSCQSRPRVSMTGAEIAYLPCQDYASNSSLKQFAFIGAKWRRKERTDQAQGLARQGW